MQCHCKVTANASIGAVGHADNLSKVRKKTNDYIYIYITISICRSIDDSLQLFRTV